MTAIVLIMNRSNYFNFIEEKLSFLATRIEIRGESNILDLHLHSENFYLHFFNLLFDWKLQNINVVDQNAAGVDLVDTTNKIIVQVSATATKQKVESALAKDLSTYKGYSFKFIFISKDAKKLRAKSFSSPPNVIFKPAKDIFDVPSLLKIIAVMDIDRLEQICEFLKKELKSDPAPNQLLGKMSEETGQDVEGGKDLIQIANTVHKLVQEDPNKRYFQKHLAAFRKAKNTFGNVLKEAQEAAITNPDLRYDYDEWRDKDKEPPKPPKEGYEVEDHYVLDDYPKGFWRPPLPFSPEGYLQRFQCKLFGLFTREDKPRNKDEMLMCEFALIAAIRDEALDIPGCDRLTDFRKDDWVQSLWELVSNKGVTGDDISTYAERMRNINTAFNNVLAKLAAQSSESLESIVDQIKKVLNKNSTPQKPAKEVGGFNREISKRLAFIDILRALNTTTNCFYRDSSQINMVCLKTSIRELFKFFGIRRADLEAMYVAADKLPYLEEFKQKALSALEGRIGKNPDTDEVGYLIDLLCSVLLGRNVVSWQGNKFDQIRNVAELKIRSTAFAYKISQSLQSDLDRHTRT